MARVGDVHLSAHSVFESDPLVSIEAANRNTPFVHAEASLEGALCVALGDGTHKTSIAIVHPQPLAENAAEDSMLVLTQLAGAAATALRNIHTFNIERRIAITLQHSLLPDEIPTIPHVDIAARYRANAEHAEVGGDFYEVFYLDEDRVAIALGDVEGHSLEAASIMAQLRTAIRAYMLEGHSPTKTLERLNNLLQRFHSGTTATACCMIYKWKTGECEIGNAGHPPALLLTPEGVEFLPLGGGLLGVSSPTAFPHHMVLEPGNAMVLYTDGLIERRGESIDVGMSRLAATANQFNQDLDILCDRMLGDTESPQQADDIAIVALRRHR
jgi:serine phosphatase RsbU (regulator of sigma subunit)